MTADCTREVAQHALLTVLEGAFAYAHQSFVGLDFEKDEVSPTRS
jgi:hypothetical protein